jgi:thiol-disulfide isomerase/thioredoxin
MRPLTLILLGSLGLLTLGDRGAAQEKGVTVQEVKYAGLQDLVLKNRGKVVVVDFWATNCVPCIRNFPHMLETQKKYGKNGLVSISVSLDKVDKMVFKDDTPEKRKERVLKLLEKLGSTIPNVILDEPQKLVEEKLRITAIPCVYVFNRQGKWTKFGGDDDSIVSPPEVEKLVVELLQETKN